MSANGDVGVSSADDSDVEGGADAPAPAANAAAPLVDIIEADASGNPPIRRCIPRCSTRTERL